MYTMSGSISGHKATGGYKTLGVDYYSYHVATRSPGLSMDTYIHSMYICRFLTAPQWYFVLRTMVDIAVRRLAAGPKGHVPADN